MSNQVAFQDQGSVHHCHGTKENLNGGIIASLIDCHSLNLAIAHAYRIEQRPIGSAPRIAKLEDGVMACWSNGPSTTPLLQHSNCFILLWNTPLSVKPV